MTVNAATGPISGAPTQTGAFNIALGATNASGTGTGALALAVLPDLPAVTLTATTPTATVGSGEIGQFTLSLSAPVANDLVINLTIKGSAANGTDYVLLKDTKKIKAGHTSKPIKITPLGNLGGLSQKTVVLTLEAGDGYYVGTAGKVKVKLLAPTP